MIEGEHLFDFFVAERNVSFLHTNLGTFQNIQTAKGHKIPVHFTSKVTKQGKGRAGKMGGGFGEMEGWVEDRCSLAAAIFLALSGWLEGGAGAAHRGRHNNPHHPAFPTNHL